MQVSSFLAGVIRYYLVLIKQLKNVIAVLSIKEPKILETFLMVKERATKMFPFYRFFVLTGAKCGGFKQFHMKIKYFWYNIQCGSVW